MRKASKHLKRIFIVLIITIIIGSFIFVLNSIGVEAMTIPSYEGSVYQNSSGNTYLDYLINKEINRPNREYKLDATTNYTYEDKEYDGMVSIVNLNEISGLLIPETGEIKYTVDINETGYYNIKIKYYAIAGRSSSISKGIKINDVYQFVEAKSFSLSRIWQDEFNVEEKRVEKNHDIKPPQVEKLRWNEETIRNIEGYYDGAYLFYFEKGTNTITFIADREPVVFNEITIFQEEATKSYEETYQTYLTKGYEKKASNKIVYKVQGENAYEKSTPILSPIANYTSYKIEPYAKFLTRYNTIGGVNWKVAGDWISWELDVEEAGLYQITFKYLQNYSRGLQSSRILYLNGEVPFTECKNITFNYNSDWQNETIGNGYWFYLNKGKNILSLETTIGSYAEVARIINEVIADLNWLYRKVIMRTGVNPSKYHDFQLEENIPNLYKVINSSIEKLDFTINEVIKIAGERSDLIASLERTKSQLEQFNESEKKIQIGLDELETNITALGTWVMTVSSQPLSIDYIVVHGEETKLQKATTNFFQKFGHELVMLIGSYFSDSSLKSSVSCEGETIEVWLMSGRDQSNLLRQLIDENFTLQNGVNVELKLVTGSVLLPATLSGNGPDVAIGVGQNIPVNWGLRNSVVDLTVFEDFNEVKEQFYESALTPFTFNGSVYALPDTQDFLIQFVRTDIFDELGLVDTNGNIITPTNWDEVVDLLPILQRQYLDYYLPNTTGALSPLLYTMIKQYGGELYLNNGAESGMMLPESANAFYDFVNFYRNYGFDISSNFTNCFRTGEMPIGVASYTLYNTLSVSAPEIRGNWSFTPLPGHKNEDNTTSYATTASSSGTIILSQTTKLQSAWKFLKWWLSDTTQASYARGMEAILGAAARYSTANKKAFASLPWSSKDYRILEEQRKYAIGIPVVPGDYIVGRYIDNAFRKVINDDINPSDSLFNYYQKINIELTRKRKEFNLD